DDVVAVPPRERNVVVLLVPLAFGVADEVEPVLPPVFAERLACKQSIDHALASLGRLVGFERLELFDSRGQAREVERHAAEPRCAVGGARGRKARRFELREHETIGVVAWPIGLRDFRNRWASHWLPRPVRRATGFEVEL